MAYITNADVFRVTGIPSDGSVISTADIDSFIGEAEDYVREMLGTYYDGDGTGTQVTETYDGTGTDTLFLNHYPLISLDSVTIDGTSVTTSAIYQYPETGKLILKTTAEKTVWDNDDPRLVSIQYTYGEQAPERVKHFTAMLCAKMVFIAQIGGTFDDVTSFQLPELGGSLGEPYTNIRESLNQLWKLEEQLKKTVWIKPQFG